MKTNWLTAAATAALIVLVAGCDYIDEDAEEPETADARGLSLALETPATLGYGEEGTLRLALANQGDEARQDVRAELYVPTWIELSQVQPAGMEVSMVALEGEGLRLTYHTGDPPIQAGETTTVEQRFRIPPEGWWAAGEPVEGDRVLRARLVSEDGEVLGAEVRSELRLDTTVARAVEERATRAPEATDVRVERDGIGPVRLGMSADQLRDSVPEARDTTWTEEGMETTGLVVPLGDGRQVSARITGGDVDQIMVRDEAVLTVDGVGVGSTLSELREAYDETCVGEVEGRVVVWFPEEPGVTFELGGIPDEQVLAAEGDPDALPGSARVERLWVREGTDECPV